LGLMLIFLYEYLREQDGPARNFDIMDPDTGVYNRAYLEMRLRQEVSRAQRNNGKLSLALISLKQRGAVNGGDNIDREAMPSVAIIFDPLLRDEDLLARYDESTFALMLPDMSGAEAQVAVETMRLRLGSAPVAPDQFERLTGLRGAAGVTELSSVDHDEVNLFRRADEALRDAERGTYGRVILRSLPAAEPVYQPPADAQLQPLGGAPADRTVSHVAATNGNGAAPRSDEQPAAVQLAPKPPLTRAALKLAQQYGIDPDTVHGSGKDGRVLKSDIKALINSDPELGFST
jgi:diguanylate cyclase (GGDEF)-like protein